MGFTWYSGPSSHFPPMKEWESFNDIYNANKHIMLSTVDNNDNFNRIRNDIQECTKTGVEERVIICSIMQESTGNVAVRAIWNADGHATAGLMRCDGSPGFPGRHGLSPVISQAFMTPEWEVVSLLPTSSQQEISSMVRAGTQHLKANLQE